MLSVYSLLDEIGDSFLRVDERLCGSSLHIHSHTPNEILVINKQGVWTGDKQIPKQLLHGLSEKEGISSTEQVQPVCQRAADRLLWNTKIKERGTFRMP